MALGAGRRPAQRRTLQVFHPYLVSLLNSQDDVKFPPSVLCLVDFSRPQFGNFVLVNIGNPIDLGDLVACSEYLQADDRLKRKLITDRIQDELYVLKEQTEKLYTKLKPK